MKRILVTYATMAGSTAEIAQAVGEEIAKSGLQVDVRPISEITNLETYAAVVVGGPMIMGWHRAALRFLRKNRAALQKLPLAVFVSAMRLTKTGKMSAGEIPITMDEKLPRPPENADRLNFKERYASLNNYLRPILRAAHPARPASIGLFGGRLEFGRLKWWAVLFAMLIVQAQAGDKRNWPVIRGWAAELPEAFNLQEH